MPKGVFAPPRSVVEHQLPQWLEMGPFVTPTDSISTGNSTGEIILEYFPPNSIFLLGIGYRLVTAFMGASNDVFPELSFGDTSNPYKFGTLNSVQLTDTGLGSTDAIGGMSGYLPVFFQDTSSDGMVLAAHWSLGSGARLAAEDTGIATELDTGELELFLHYRARFDRESPLRGGANVT